MLCLSLLAVGSVLGQTPATGDRLHQLRAQRRAAQQALQAQADKSGSPVTFGLLVIPVDFSDARLSAGWNPTTDLAPQLFAEDNPSLARYFAVASAGKLDLRITLAPLVHLPGDRRSYSDIGYNGYSRTRALATEALTAVRDQGLEFRRLDNDGPDGLPGTADDDGQVDGVLILHGAPGQENDASDGLIQPLQFYLDEPVVDEGVTASFYAVASLHSGHGIWAHETGHLLGMEDRYDFLLHPDSGAADVRSLGGLGRFSLMASGAWGGGDGLDPALPDAYTCSQLGWYPVEDLPAYSGDPHDLLPGRAYRIWQGGQIGSEYFMLEVRAPQVDNPYDAQVPAGNLLVYHVDETVPEGGYKLEGGGQWHLRARLVEADGNTSLADGQDDGSLADLFPGSLGVTQLTPASQPSSWGYTGNSGVALTGIVGSAAGVEVAASAVTGPLFEASLGFDSEGVVQFNATSLGEPVDQLSAQLSLLSIGDGMFDSWSIHATFALEDEGDGRWVPGEPPTFIPEAGLAPGHETLFRLTLSDGTWSTQQDLVWVWSTASGILDFQTHWPGEWTITFGGGDESTTWHQWSEGAGLTLGPTAVLAATGAQFSRPDSWEEVHYENSAHTLLRSGLLGPDVASVQIVHAMEVEVLASGEAMDGGAIFWEAPRGELVPATVLGGYPGRVHPGSSCFLAGRAAFADSSLSFTETGATWRVDEVPVPEGPGPWRLVLGFGSNSLWRRHGWFVAGLYPQASTGQKTPFQVSWDPELGMSYAWRVSDLMLNAVGLERWDPASGQWVEVRQYLVDGNEGGPFRVVEDLDLAPSTRYLVRLVGFTSLGGVASRPVVVYPDGGADQSVDALHLLGPNPARGQVNFQVRVPADKSVRVQIFDIRGRLIRSLPFSGGDYLTHWDGKNQDGGRMASGVYFIRLDGSGPALTRKVVLFH